MESIRVYRPSPTELLLEVEARLLAARSLPLPSAELSTQKDQPR